MMNAIIDCIDLVLIVVAVVVDGVVVAVADAVAKQRKWEV